MSDIIDPCEEMLAREALDFVRALVRAKKYRLDGDLKADIFEHPEPHVQLVGWVRLPDALTEALRMTGLLDE